jgi:hypothetical protein
MCNHLAMSRDNIPADAALARLRDACTGVRTSIEDIADLLPEPQGKPRSGTIGRHAPESSEPWQGEAAAVYWAIHFGARRLEEDMRHAAGIPPHDPARGGSNANTNFALTAIADLGVSVPEPHLRDAMRQVERWANMIGRLSDIDQADMWTPVPRQPGAMPPACPYCGLFTLRMSIRREIVRCFNPPCRDNDNHPPVARMERGRLTGDGMLVFGDGTVIHYRGEAAETAA